MRAADWAAAYLMCSDSLRKFLRADFCATDSRIERLSQRRRSGGLMKRVRGQLATGALLVGWVLASTAIPASASLGGGAASIESDASAMAGKISASPQKQEESSTYSIASFVTGNGVTVREYSAHTGSVFGVAWQGRRPPDLSVLLGSYYPEYVAATSAPQAPVALHHAVIVGPNSVVFLGGHMGHLTGRAYVPNLVPSGVDARAVVK
jgi:hypothetical protein